MQEDQIYALQDYINQYQRLLCQYRSENSSLKRQLSENYSAVSPQATESQPNSPSRLVRPREGSAPPFQAPSTPGVKQQQVPASPSPQNVEPPDVPPLKSTTDDDSRHSTDEIAGMNAAKNAGPVVMQTVYDEQNSRRRSQSVVNSLAPADARQSIEIVTVMVSGQVIANPSGGPRLMVDVVPFDANGQVQPFEGSASIMLLGVDEDGKEHSQGRWDYTPDDVRAALNTATGTPTMRYFIELPANKQVAGAIQLWVRLKKQSGAKLLAHANIDVNHPGNFASGIEKPEPQSTDVVAAGYTQEAPTEDASAPASDTPEMPTSNVESNWVVAQPGKPANLPPEASDESGAGGWRASTQTIPAVVEAVESNTKPNPTAPILAPLRQAQRSAPPAAATSARRPSWSSDRSSDAAQKDATKPSWSATR